MPSHFRIEVAAEDEIPDLAALITPTFADIPLEILVGNVDRPEAIKASGERHQRAWREHFEETGRPSAIKCVHTDPKTGKETMAACAEWYIFDKPRSAENAKKVNYLVSARWLSNENGERTKAQEAFKPMADARIKWTEGRAHALFMYMATDKNWRRQGAATICVQWGVDKCRELGVPAYLEASDQGKPVYEKLGFEQVQEVEIELDGVKSSFPTMMWWPPGTKDEDKKPFNNQQQ